MNNDNVSTPEVFDITKYPKEDYVNSRGEELTRYIVPDDVFEEYLKQLPDGTVNESKSKRAFHGGALGIFGADPEEDLIKQRAGRVAQSAAYRQRRTFKEEADILLANVDKKTGKTGIENITIAMYERALLGDVKAYTALRDTAGEKPVEAVDLNANIMTEADQALIQKLKSRTGIE
jgi:hypothetical protein